MPAVAAPLDCTELLRPERDALVGLLRGLTPDEWNRPTECPAWDVKGIALHVLGDDLSLLSRQRDASIDSVRLYAERHPGLGFRALLDGFNQEWVAAAQFLSTEMVIELLEVVGDSSETFYREVGLGTSARETVLFFSATGPSPYWQVIAREYAERFIHQSQIRRAIGAHELDGALVGIAAAVSVHALAARLAAYVPPVGVAIALEFVTFGSWTWVREADRWRVADGAAQDADARVVVSADDTVSLLSRAFSPDQVRSSMAVVGDEALADPASEIVVSFLHRP